MMMRDTKSNTTDIHLAKLADIASKSNTVCCPRINANNTTNRDNNNDTDAKSRSSDISLSAEDTFNMFTKFAFPFKLHAILESSSRASGVRLGHDAIISWHSSGIAFKIHKPKEFANTIMPHYFNQSTKFRSFQRQLYIYEFERIKDKTSENYGAYFHKLFIRGATDLCADMKRKKIKGTGLSNQERRSRKKALYDEHNNK